MVDPPVTEADARWRAGPDLPVAAGVEQLLQQYDAGFLPCLATEQIRGVRSHRHLCPGDCLSGVVVGGEPVWWYPQMQLQAGRGGIGSDRVGGELDRLSPVDDAHQERPVTRGAHAAGQQLVARVVGKPLDGQLLGAEGRQHADGDQSNAEPLDPCPACLERVGEVALTVAQHPALQPMWSEVQLDVELAELVLHVRPAQPRQDGIID